MGHPVGTSQRLHQLDQNSKSTPYAINIGGQNIRRVKSVVSYLCMKVDDKLTWDHHIAANISRYIGNLKRIKHFIPHDSLLLLYHTLIDTYFRYCNIIWRQCGEVLKDGLQTLQNKAARTIARTKYGDASHHELLAGPGWLTVIISLNLTWESLYTKN